VRKRRVGDSLQPPQPICVSAKTPLHHGILDDRRALWNTCGNRLSPGDLIVDGAAVGVVAQA
jgi:hypothetical protein